MRSIKPTVKVGLVAGGFVASFLVASAAVAIRVASTSGPDAQASSGMYSFGDSALFVTVFGVAALVPTAGALYLLRPYRRFWTVLSGFAVLVAVSGAVAAILFVVGRHAVGPSTLATWASLSVLRILVAPLLALVFLLAGEAAPHRSPRLALLAAAFVEVAVCACGGFVWIFSR